MSFDSCLILSLHSASKDNMEDIVEHSQIGALATQHDRVDHSPIERVPAEILCDIFLSWIEEHSWNVEHPIIFPHSPFLLARVCSQWRKIIYGTPHLWASPHVRIPSGMYITNQWMEKLVAYLARSKACPLSVTLEASRHHTFASGLQKGLEKLIRALIPHVERIYSLHISLTQSACKELQYFAIGEDGWSNLERLTITTWGPPLLGSIVQDRPLVFAKAPKLRELTLVADKRRGSRLLRTLTLTLPWAQITKLTTSEVFRTSAAARDIILKCPLLEHCSLGHVNVWPEGQVAPDLPTRTFPHLRALSVIFDDNERFLDHEASFFQPLVMPALQRLDIRATEPPESAETPTYISFIYSHCGSTLTHLSIDSILFYDEDAVVVLKLLPALVSFRASLTYAATRDDFFHALTYDATSAATPLVPRLESLDIDEYPPSEGLETVRTSLVVKAIASRWWSDAELAGTLHTATTSASMPSVARLKHVRLSWDFDESPSESDAATIGRCKDEGLDVWISGMPRKDLTQYISDYGSEDIDYEALAARLSVGDGDGSN